MRDTLFISHANPENNYFSAWLASKLRLLGYKVWVDVSNINPGQYFNQDFERALREDAIRVLAVVSKDYILKSRRPDSGVMNEIQLARGIRDIDGFIVPLHLDDASYNDYPVGINGRLAIPFNENWATGLRELVAYLDDNKIPREQPSANPIHFWHQAQKINAEPLEKQERYFANWFPVAMPAHIYIHQPEIMVEQDLSDMPYSYIREGDRLITFVSAETIQQYTPIRSTYQYSTQELFETEVLRVDKGFELVAPNKKLVKLLNKTFKSYLYRNQLRSFTQASKRDIFYFPFTEANYKMVSLKQLGKSRRSIMGDNEKFRWHFAISFHAALHPMPCFRVSYHLFFTDHRGKPLQTDDQHELRRSFPSTWFNRKWLETLLAMMVKISNFDPSHSLKIEVDTNHFLTVQVLPVNVISSIGYNEPNLEAKVLS